MLQVTIIAQHSLLTALLPAASSFYIEIGNMPSHRPRSGLSSGILDREFRTASSAETVSTTGVRPIYPWEAANRLDQGPLGKSPA
jgi:hypothetical protein